MSLIIILLLISGLIGGTYRTLIEIDEKRYMKCLRGETEDYISINSENTLLFTKNILMSSIASFLVPLFMIIVNNGYFEDVDQLKLFSTQFFYILGFSLIAAVYANAFIDGMHKKMMSKLEENSKKLEENSKEFDEIKKEHAVEKEKNQELEKKVNVAERERHISSLLHRSSETKLNLILLDDDEKKSGTINKDALKDILDEIDNILSDESSLQLGKSLQTLYSNKAYILKRIGSVEESIKMLEEAIKRVGPSANMLYNLSCYYAIEKDDDKFYKTIEKLFYIDPMEILNLETDDDIKDYVVKEGFTAFVSKAKTVL